MTPPPPRAPVTVLEQDELPLGESPPENSIIRRGGGDASRPSSFQVEVLAVVDGDTFVARQTERLFLFELRDVESPELEQPHGREARQRLATLIENRRIDVRPAKSQQHGCLMSTRAEVEGQDVAEQLLAEGSVWARDSAPESWHRLQAVARLEGLGFWRTSGPEPPWEYRARRTMARNAERP